MNFYIASKSQAVAREWRSILEAEGFKVIAGWLDEEDFGKGPPYDAPSRAMNAVLDENDVRKADALILRASPDLEKTKGGRHVETGMAIALCKPVYVVGPRENIFHWHPSVKMFDSFDDLVEYLKGL
jgi:nucleoside 2-deoxyribosyltransferase